jgi:hypothetical protein
VEKYDKLPEGYTESEQAAIKFFKYGHQAILSQPQGRNAPLQKTTYKDDFVQKSKLYSESEAKGNKNKHRSFIAKILINSALFLLWLGIRYQLAAEEIRRQLLKEMETDEKMNDPSQEPISYETEVRSNYVVPGFVHVPPKPTTVREK